MGCLGFKVQSLGLGCSGYRVYSFCFMVFGLALKIAAVWYVLLAGGKFSSDSETGRDVGCVLKLFGAALLPWRFWRPSPDY